MTIKFFDKPWGFLMLEISKYKFDFLPRLTVVSAPLAFEMHLGFAFFRFQFTLWGKKMQEWLENNPQ